MFKLTSNKLRNLHIFVTILFLVIFYISTYYYKPIPPKNDFGLYWRSAHDLSLYKKGGPILMPYSLAGYLNLSSYTSALIINSVFWLFFSWAFWFDPRTKDGFSIQLIATLIIFLSGISWSGMSGLVNSDMPHLALLSLIARQINDFLITKNTTWKALLLIFLISIAYSMRPSSFLPSLLFIFLASLYYYKDYYFTYTTGVDLQKKRPTLTKTIKYLSYKIKLLGLIIAIGLTLAIGIELGFRHFSANQVAIRVHSRATLYTGLFYTQCGYLNMEAIHKTTEEIDKPIKEVFAENIQRIGIGRISSIMLCKINNWLNFDDFSYEFIELFYNLEQLDINPADYPRKMNPVNIGYLESISVKSIKILLIGYTAICLHAKKNKWAILSLLLYMSYFSQHLILEIQPRYAFIPLCLSFLILLITENQKPTLSIANQKKTAI